MAKRVMDRRTLRAQADAAERLEGDAGAATGEAVVAGEETVVAPKKKKAEPKPRKPRARTPKAPVRMRIVWTVFNNSNHPVAKYDYPKKDEADAHAARLAVEKKIPHFVIPVKEPIEEKLE
jgi:hypothetical protein